MNSPAVGTPAAPLSLTTPESGESFAFLTSARGRTGRFSFEWRLAPGSVGPGLHVHPHEAERFRVISGRLDVFVHGVRYPLGPGDTFEVPAGEPHHFGHPGEEETVVEVSLDGHRMEDQFVPLAVRYDSPKKLQLSALPQVVVHIHHAMVNGGNVPCSRLLLGAIGAIAAVFRAFGLRPLPPVEGWEVA